MGGHLGHVFHLHVTLALVLHAHIQHVLLHLAPVFHVHVLLSSGQPESSVPLKHMLVLHL